MWPSGKHVDWSLRMQWFVLRQARKYHGRLDTNPPKAPVRPPLPRKAIWAQLVTQLSDPPSATAQALARAVSASGMRRSRLTPQCLLQGSKRDTIAAESVLEVHPTMKLYLKKMLANSAVWNKPEEFVDRSVGTAPPPTASKPYRKEMYSCLRFSMRSPACTCRAICSSQQ